MATGGFGLQVQITVSNTLTAIANLRSPNMPELEKVMAEVTGHDAAGGYEEHLPTGKFRMTEFQAELVWDQSEATHAAIMAAFAETATPVQMKVIAPNDVESITFNAWISKISRVSDQEGAYMATVTIRPTGQPTLAVGSGS